MSEIKKRTRRSDEVILADTITALYVTISNRIKNIDENKEIVDQVFEALRPLRELHDSYKMVAAPSKEHHEWGNDHTLEFKECCKDN